MTRNLCTLYLVMRREVVPWRDPPTCAAAAPRRKIVPPCRRERLAVSRRQPSLCTHSPRCPMIVRTSVKAGSINGSNHSQAVTVRTGVKGGATNNHSQAPIVVRTGVRGGGLFGLQHAQALAVRTGVKAGGCGSLGNNAQALAVRTRLKSGSWGQDQPQVHLAVKDNAAGQHLPPLGWSAAH